MPNKNKALGTAGERMIVERAQKAGMTAKRQPLSGVLPDYPHDVTLLTKRQQRILVESKVATIQVSAKGARHFPLEFDWLYRVRADAAKSGEFDGAVLVVRPKGTSKMMAVLDFDDYIALLQGR